MNMSEGYVFHLYIIPYDITLYMISHSIERAFAFTKKVMQTQRGM